MIDIGFEEMAALKHSLKIALRVYDELQNSRFVCVQTKSHDRGPQEHWFGLLQVSPSMDSALFASMPWQLFARNGTILWQKIAALHWLMTVCRLRRCCWVLIEQVQNVICHNQMQLGSAMSLRIVRASCLVCFVKCHDGQPDCQQVFAD